MSEPKVPLVPSVFMKAAEAAIVRLKVMMRYKLPLQVKMGDRISENLGSATVYYRENLVTGFVVDFYDEERKQFKCFTTARTEKNYEPNFKPASGSQGTLTEPWLTQHQTLGEWSVTEEALTEKELLQKFLSFYDSDEVRKQIEQLGNPQPEPAAPIAPRSEPASVPRDQDELEGEEDEDEELVTRKELEERLEEFKKPDDEDEEFVTEEKLEKRLEQFLDEEFESGDSEGGKGETRAIVIGELLKSLTPEWKASMKKGVCPFCGKKTGNFANLLGHYWSPKSGHLEEKEE
jgi:hypothetical protein